MGPLAMFGLDFGKDLVNNVIQGFSNRAQRKHDMRMQDRAHANSMSAWREQTAYNTPAMQMQRFEEAGLNPNLMYGQGTPGNATPAPQAKASTGNYDLPGLTLENALVRYQDFEAKQAQINNIKAINDNLKVDKQVKEANLGLKQWALKISDHKYNYQTEFFTQKTKQQKWETLKSIYNAIKEGNISQKEANLARKALLEGNWQDIKNTKMEKENTNIDKDDFITRGIYSTIWNFILDKAKQGTDAFTFPFRPNSEFDSNNNPYIPPN